MSDDEVVGLVGAARRLRCRAEWLELRGTREFARRRWESGAVPVRELTSITAEGLMYGSKSGSTETSRLAARIGNFASRANSFRAAGPRSNS